MGPHSLDPLQPPNQRMLLRTSSPLRGLQSPVLKNGDIFCFPIFDTVIPRCDFQLHSFLSIILFVEYTNYIIISHFTSFYPPWSQLLSATHGTTTSHEPAILPIIIFEASLPSNACVEDFVVHSQWKSTLKYIQFPEPGSEKELKGFFFQNVMNTFSLG